MNLSKTCFTLACGAATVFSYSAWGAPNDSPFRVGTVLLGFRTGITQTEQSAILQAIGAVELKRIGAGTRVVRVNNGFEMAAIALLLKFGAIRYAEPDFRHKVTGGTIPNDPSVGSQWAVQNTGQTLNGVTGTPGADQKSPLAWRITTGTNSVVVAITDTGVQYTHPDLAANIWTNPGGIGGCPAGTHGFNVLDNNCDPMDDDAIYGGHGTHVAGIIGAVGNNGQVITGVNWTTSIMPIKFVDSQTNGYTSDLITGLDWVISAKQAGVNVRVVNDSANWTGTGVSQAMSDEIDLLGSNDILFVSAAGNSGVNNDTTPRYPCTYNRPNQLCVAASDQNDNLWSSSNFGSNTVQLAAPGSNVYSTERMSNYGYISGCSMAVPQVAGTAALILSLGYQPVATLRSMILNSVDQLPSLAAFVSTGGRLNVCKAIPGCTTAVSGTPVNTGLPVVTGTPQYGSILGASTGIWSGLPTGYTYQWYRCNSGGLSCAPIAGAASQNYPLLAPADVGATFRVTVTAANASAATLAQSAASVPASGAVTPFATGSSILDGSTISGVVLWQASPPQAVNFVQFYIDGVLTQTVSSAPYVLTLDTTILTPGSHVFGVRALAYDNRTYAFSGASATVSVSTSTTPKLVQSNAIEGSGVPSISAAFSQPNTTGNLIVAFVRMSTDTQAVNVTDAAGNVYIDAVNQTQSADGHQIHLFYAKNVRGGVNSVTAAFSGINNHPWLAIYEYSGISQTNPLDQTAAGQGAGLVANSGTTATTSSANELVFAGAGFVNDFTGTVSAGGGNTLLQQDTGASRAASAAALTASVGSFASVFNLSVSADWSAVVATFLPAGASISPLSITTSSLPGATQSISYNAALAASGGVAPYSWSIASGALPSGLTLNAATGAITGIPGGIGTSNFTVQVTDRNSSSATQPLSIAVSPGASGIALLQSNAVEGSGARSIAVSFPAPNTLGNLIIAFVRMSSTGQSVTITDTSGNVYRDAVTQGQTTDGHQIHLFYAKNIAGGTNTVTATFSAANNHPWLAVFEYRGLNSVNPLDRTARAQGNNGSPVTSATSVTTSANELVFAGLGVPNDYSGVIAAGVGYGLQLQDSALARAATEAQLVNGTGAFKGTFGISAGTNWSAVVATFKP